MDKADSTRPLRNAKQVESALGVNLPPRHTKTSSMHE
jgi:hypothetical protein